MHTKNNNIIIIIAPFTTQSKSYYPADAYSQSKLAQILFSRHLDAKLKETGANVHSYAVHPGVVNTGLFDTTGIGSLPWFRALFFKVRICNTISFIK